MSDCFRRRHNRTAVSYPTAITLREQIRSLFFAVVTNTSPQCRDLGRLIGRVEVLQSRNGSADLEAVSLQPGDPCAQLLELLEAVAHHVEPTPTQARNVVERARSSFMQSSAPGDRYGHLEYRFADALKAAGLATPTVRVLQMIRQGVVGIGLSHLRTEFFAADTLAFMRDVRSARGWRVLIDLRDANGVSVTHIRRETCGDPRVGAAAAFEVEWSVCLTFDALVSNIALAQLRLDSVSPNPEMDPARRQQVLHDLCAAGDAALILGANRVPNTDTAQLDIGLPTNFKHVVHIGHALEAHQPETTGVTI